MAVPQEGTPRRGARPVGRPRKNPEEPPQKRRRLAHSPADHESRVQIKEDEGNSEITVIPRSAMQTRPRRGRPQRYVPPLSTPRPRYSNSASAAAASQVSDGYKPREERSWEDFHPDLDIDARLLVYTADEVDGRNKDNPVSAAIAQLAAQREAEKARLEGAEHEKGTSTFSTPIKRKPGRPARRPESMLSGLGSPPAPRIVPLPTHNPKERLNLPKPSFREFSHFLKFEQDQKENKVNYVDRTMANIGYQESDQFDLPDQALIRLGEGHHLDDDEVALTLASDLKQGDAPNAVAPVVSQVEYDMDEQDEEWLEAINEQRKLDGVEAIKPAVFEIVMTQIEKEYHALEKRIPKPQPRHAQTHRPRSSSQAAVNGDPNPPGDEPDSKCAICDDGDCENANAIIFCDGCDLAVHQECYGVPFIPEGQWFCRKCKEIGRGTATCVFCPNVDGAFKQTTTLRWSHLLCAIWIPEVTIANPTFMEPITDVDKVPKSRWKLNCYICNQKMGACIQCANKACYQAFHVTCARKAKLFLKMKTPHHAGIDSTALKAFCDKHVPPEWRRLQDTDRAILEAKRWYRHTFKEHRWADNQIVAQELGAPPPPDGGLDNAETAIEDNVFVGSAKRKKNEKPKIYWRLPSGAPVVPAVVYEAVEASLVRFMLRKRKEFTEKVCRYWTLKREARRGAALLKRLQLQLESFSSMEITRRSFVGLAGRDKLERRIRFADQLQSDMAYCVQLANMVEQREALRLQELQSLKTLVDTVYFPVPALLLPILQRAQKLDEKGNMFSAELEIMHERLRERYYTSVTQFSKDLGAMFLAKLEPQSSTTNDEDSRPPTATGERDLESIHDQLNEVRPGTAQHLALSTQQREIKKMAKRIVKAVKEPIEDAMRKEAELRGLDREEVLRHLDSLPLFASADIKDEDTTSSRTRTRNAASYGGNDDTHMMDIDDPQDSFTKANATPSSAAESTSSTNGRTKGRRKQKAPQPAEPLSPPASLLSVQRSGDTSQQDVFAEGGVPWYLEAFHPEGTNIYHEKYNGQDVLRNMSEELTDMDEDTLTELAVNGKSKPKKSSNAKPSNSLASVKSRNTRAGARSTPTSKKGVTTSPAIRKMTRSRA